MSVDAAAVLSVGRKAESMNAIPVFWLQHIKGVNWSMDVWWPSPGWWKEHQISLVSYSYHSENNLTAEITAHSSLQWQSMAWCRSYGMRFRNHKLKASMLVIRALTNSHNFSNWILPALLNRHTLRKGARRKKSPTTNSILSSTP